MSAAGTEMTVRLGRRLRRIPGLRPVLDARVARLRRRDLGREAMRREAESEEAERRSEATRADGARRLRELAHRGGLRINVGSSAATLDGWVNVDIQVDWEDTIYMDAADRWPLPDGCVEAINSEHFIEHITLEAARRYFHEAARVLQPGGVIRTSTPSLRGVIHAYLEADPEMLAAYMERIEGWCEAHNHSEMLNNTFYEWGHRHIYDEEAIAEMLEEAGFAEIERAEFGRSRHAVLTGIDTHDDGEALRSLVFALDAVKPGKPNPPA
jgi:predicted SAM-dependent methyltransferase